MILVLTMQAVKEKNTQRDTEITVNETSPGIFEIYAPRPYLKSGKPLEFLITLEKVPTEIREDMMICNVTIDGAGKSMMETILNGEKRLTPHKIYSHLHDYLKYDCVRFEGSKYCGIDDTGTIKLSDLLNRGRGLCTHLSVAMLA